jgi:GT2 family glycosyltransferase
MNKLATIIIPHHNRHDHLKFLLNRIDNSLFDIIVVSGGSFAENCNRGATMAGTDKLIFANDDSQPKPTDLTEICRFLNLVDFVGSTQINSKKLKYWGIGFEYEPKGFHYNQYKPLYYPSIELVQNRSLFPSGFLFGMNRAVWDKLGGFNTEFRTGNEDVSFGIRCLQQRVSMCILDLEVYHEESQSEGRFQYVDENTRLLHEKYSQEYMKKLYESTNYCI